MNLLFLVTIVAGVFVVSQMPVDVYPDVDLDEASIDTFWPGASAEDVERLITGRIEDAIADVRGVSRIRSDSKPDASLIRAKFHENLTSNQLDAAFRELRSAIDRVADLPVDAERPVVTRISLSEVFPLLWVIVEDRGHLGEDAIHEAALALKPRLREIPGIAKIDDKLIRDREIHVRANHDRLAEYGLTLDRVAAILRQYNRDVPSGTLRHRDGELTIRAAGEVDTPEDLAKIAVRKDPSGAHVYLGDIASIERGFERKTFFARLNGNACKAISVAKSDDADSREVADRIAEAVSAFEQQLPAGIRVSTCLDSSQIIRSRMRILVSNLSTGVFLVFMTLWIVMGFRNSVLATIGIPFAFLCSFIFMNLLGVTISAVSLFALVLCSGMVVDDAIVVLENIYRHVAEGRRREQTEGAEFSLTASIINGTTEVMWPVISSSATTVLAFLPMLIMEGVTGKFFSIIPKTVAVVLLASLCECLLMIPVHYLAIGPWSETRSKWASFWSKEQKPRESKSSGWMVRFYVAILDLTLRHRYLAPLPLIGLGFLAYAYWQQLPVELFPSDYQFVFVDLKAWDEASLDDTQELAAPIERIALSLGPDYVASVLASFGLVASDENAPMWRNNLAQLHVQLADTPQVRSDPDAVSRRLRSEIEAYLSNHPDSRLESFKIWARQDGPPVGKPVDIRIETDDFAEAKRLAAMYLASLSSIPGVFGIEDNLDFGPRQINLRLREDMASVHGLSEPHLWQALRTANDGAIVSSFKDTQSGEDLDVRIMLRESDRKTLDDLLRVEVQSPLGYTVKLDEICELDTTQGYASIPHVNGKRAIRVTAEIDPAINTSIAVNRALTERFEPFLGNRRGVRVSYGGEYKETARSFRSLEQAYVIALGLIYLLLATQFRSYLQPLIIILTAPFSCVGVVAGLVLGEYPFSITTLIAMVGLTGVVVNDSIVLLDFINHQVKPGRDVAEAIKTACITRLRPVVVTTVTTVLGLLPLAMGWSGRSKVWSPFASSFACGLAFSTVVTLLIVPAVYHIVYDVVNLRRRDPNVESPQEPVVAAAHSR
jgi:HAE1 family hydrophobic/amphiphilic exporter-1